MAIRASTGPVAVVVRCYAEGCPSQRVVLLDGEPLPADLGFICPDCQEAAWVPTELVPALAEQPRNGRAAGAHPPTAARQ